MFLGGGKVLNMERLFSRLHTPVNVSFILRRRLKCKNLGSNRKQRRFVFSELL